jgi:hypothetical protein
MSSLRSTVLVFAATLGLASIPSLAQPARDGTPPPPRERGAGQGQSRPQRPMATENDPAALRQMIERRLRENQRIEGRLTEALKRLDEGASPAEVARELMPLMGRPEGPDAGPPDERPRPQAPGQGGQRRDGPLTPQEREEFIQLLKDRTPVIARKFHQWQQEPAFGQRLVGRMTPRIRDAMALRRTDQEMFDLRIEEIFAGALLLEAIKNYREATVTEDSGREQRLSDAREGLRSALVRQFQARLGSESLEAERLTARVERMRRHIEERRERADEEADAALKRLMETGDFREVMPEDGPPGRPPMRQPPRAD